MVNNHNTWEHFHHAADIGIRGIAESVEQAFENAAYAMTAVMIDPKHIPPKQNISVSAQAPDIELLLVDWLSSIIYQTDTRKMLFSSFKVSIDGLSLNAQISGSPISKCISIPAVEVKGVTYAELAVKQNQNGLWVAQCVLDV
jgi:tRNA nucleotidyltransferase (CCA-adding enzyme)